MKLWSKNVEIICFRNLDVEDVINMDVIVCEDVRGFGRLRSVHWRTFVNAVMKFHAL